MSWIQQLVKTYDNCTAAIGVQTAAEGENEKVPLLPIAHTTYKAQVEITLDQNGNFLGAEIVPKSEARTIIPCTESSGGRTSDKTPHPLCDKLQYVAKDYSTWGGKKKSCFAEYFMQLSAWAGSRYSDPKLISIKRYVEKGSIITDLVKCGILFSDESQCLAKKSDFTREQLNTMNIFNIIDDQTEIFIRWRVYIPGNLEDRVWMDAELWKKWSDYCQALESNTGLCYVSGEQVSISTKHPAKIINNKPLAKLISSENTFTYCGRFLNANQAATIGYESSQKAHSTLRWLISRQGYQLGDFAVVAWATNGLEIPKPFDDQIDFLGINSMESLGSSEVFTAQNIAIQVRNMLAGYKQKLGNTTDISVIGIDSATDGRLSIIFYQELRSALFLERMLNWYDTCQWELNYKFLQFTDSETGGKVKKLISFVGTPAPIDIAKTVYGSCSENNTIKKSYLCLYKGLIRRIFPCIIDGNPIPSDIVQSAVRRTCSYFSARDNKDSLSSEDQKAWSLHPRKLNENWEWEKSLSIACALFRKFKPKENYKMSLEEDRTTRDYLYGRLLAIAENLENWALSSVNEKRETNAIRLFQRFSERPFTTWRTLEIALSPYKARLGGKANKLLRLMDQIINAFSPEDFTSDKPLSGEFLLGYHCQREALWSRFEQNENASEEAIEDN